MKVLILTADSNGGYPVPAVKGGAVSTLIECLIAANNKKKTCEMEVLSLYDVNAKKTATTKYPNIRFTWIKVPKILKFVDNCIFNVIRVFKKNKKAISYRSPLTLIYYIWQAKKLSDNTDADKIVIENNIPLARVMKKSKFKGDWYYHLHNVPRIDAGCRKEFQKVKKYLCVSQYVASQITSEYSAIGKIDPEKTTVLLNCIDTDLFRPIEKSDPKIIELKKRYNIDKSFVVLFTGRLSEEKGADKVLEAMKMLPDNIKCLIVGSLISDFDAYTPFHSKLKKIASSLGKRAIFTGYINQQELPYIYNIADVAVLPSLWDEPAGLTNIEAIACGLTVITTKSGGIPEYVRNNGIILERGHQLTKEISDSILNILDTPHLSKRNIEEFRKEFGIDNYLCGFIHSLQ